MRQTFDWWNKNSLILLIVHDMWIPHRSTRRSLQPQRISRSRNTSVNLIFISSQSSQQASPRAKCIMQVSSRNSEQENRTTPPKHQHYIQVKGETISQHPVNVRSRTSGPKNQMSWKCSAQPGHRFDGLVLRRGGEPGARVF